MCLLKTHSVLLTWTAFSLAAFVSCSKGTNPDEAPGTAVVQCYLFPNQPVQIKITGEIPYGSTDTLLPLTGLSVYFLSNDTPRQLGYTGNAIYATTAVSIDTGITYRLQFTYGGQTVSSSTTIPPRPTGFQASGNTITVPTPGTFPSSTDSLQPIKLTWDNPDHYYHMVVVTCIQPNPTAITFGGMVSLAGSFRTTPTQGNEQNIGPGSFSYYGLHRMVLYRLWSDYAALYYSNGNNSTDLATPPGNITNGYGIFTGINTAADTLYVTVE